jgi:murein DD-endopeptidase MepM/ murein hydrolase activator NlpD
MLMSLLASVSSPAFVSADTLPVDPAALQAEIQNRKAQISTITTQLDEYKKKIAEYAKKSSSLMNEIAILENDTAMGQLDVAATENEIASAQLELQMISANIDETDQKLSHQRELLSRLILAIHRQDAEGGPMELMVGAKKFDDVFTAAANLQAVNGDLRKTLTATKTTREALDEDLTKQNTKVENLDELRVALEKQVDALEQKKVAKTILAEQTSESEDKYRGMLDDLRQEQQSILARINDLQNKVATSQFDDGDPDPSAITWPVRGIITTLFHDPTYPFRHLFEHSGLDIAVPQGTPVAAAAPGIVAWTKTGPQYGNYVMIIHEDGLATLYAHLSRIDVKQDQFISRGEILGLSGGRPGTQGAGLSTGSHLHFEVRKGGIPVNPMTFLPK